MSTYTEGVCGDGVAILRDGVMMTISEVLAALNSAALAELERAAAEPVAWMWNDELGITHASAGPKKPVWLESSTSAEYIKQANLRPLYTTPPPAPVAEMCEPTPEECVDMAEWFKSECQECCINPQESADYGRAIFDAVKLVMGGES